jgi:hypothetical protein
VWIILKIILAKIRACFQKGNGLFVYRINKFWGKIYQYESLTLIWDDPDLEIGKRIFWYDININKVVGGDRNEHYGKSSETSLYQN